MIRSLVKVALLSILIPLNLRAVLPELSLETIREALATVSRGDGELQLTPYLRSYSHHPPASVRAIQLTTPYSRLVNRAMLSKNRRSNYTEDQAVRESWQEGPAYLEVIVTISCGWSESVSRGWLWYWDGSRIPCSVDFSLGKYQITVNFRNPNGQPASHTYAASEIIPQLFFIWTGTGKERSFSVIGGEMRVALPLAFVGPNADLEVVVSEPEGRPTKALFELSRLH